MVEGKDVFGSALLDYFKGEQQGDLRVHTTYGDPETVPVEGYFYEKEHFSEIELMALEACKGNVLDIGAGTGKHSLVVGNNAFAMDISRLCCSIMKSRGVYNIIEADVLNYSMNRFDTLLMLQNGIGLVGDIKGLEIHLNHFKNLLNKGGQLLFDSSNLSYLYNELDIPFPDNHYFGEMNYRYEYANSITNWFKWLYIDFETLEEIALKTGWKAEKLMEDDFDQFLVKLTLL